MTDLSSPGSLAGAPAEPMAPGSVCLGMHLYDVDPKVAIEALVEEARLADQVGFDGIGLSEHHQAYPGYLPSPIQGASWLLAATSRAWVAPCPTLLLLRHPRLIAEDIAWLDAAYPGRVGLGVAPGWDPRDFAIVDSTPDAMAERFEASMRTLVSALEGQDPLLAGDRAIAHEHGRRVPIVSALASSEAARRAGRVGVGIIFGFEPSWERVDRMLQAYLEAGGRGPITFVRPVWVGDDAPIEAITGLIRGHAVSAAKTAPVDNAESIIAHGQPEQVAECLLEITRHVPEASFNLRLHHRGVELAAVRRQIARIGEEVLPLLRRETRVVA